MHRPNVKYNNELSFERRDMCDVGLRDVLLRKNQGSIKGKR
jgi:hypothetical protein